MSCQQHGCQACAMWHDCVRRNLRQVQRRAVQVPPEVHEFDLDALTGELRFQNYGHGTFCIIRKELWTIDHTLRRLNLPSLVDILIKQHRNPYHVLL